MANPFISNWKRYALSPLARKVLVHMEKAGDISALDAMITYGITSASLARRICDIEEMGIKVQRLKFVHPITGQKYTRYVLAV